MRRGKKLKLITTEKERESLNSKYEGQINHVIFFHHFFRGTLICYQSNQLFRNFKRSATQREKGLGKANSGKKRSSENIRDSEKREK